MYPPKILTLDEFKAKADSARTAGDDDPEVSHYYLDQLMEDSIRSIPGDTQDPDVSEKILIVQELLDLAEKENWARWYA